MRLFAVLLSASFVGCASNRNADLTELSLEDLHPPENLAIAARDGDIGRAYRLVAVVYRIDGREVFGRAIGGRSGEIDEPARVYVGQVAPGPHRLDVEMLYETRFSRVLPGGDRMGVKSTTQFVAVPDVPTVIQPFVDIDGNVAFDIGYPEEPVAVR